MWELMIILLVLFFYMLPTFVALLMHNVNALGIFILNLGFGWTLIGWWGALIWAVIK